MLLFKSLRWKNLLSTGNAYTSITLNRNQNTLIVGENGSGKSTFLDALCFVLYNRPFRNINKTALPNSINQKDTVVDVEFQTENHHFKIVRGIKPNIFEIYRDGELVNQNAESRDYQEYLEKFILKLNYKSFTQIVILGSASFTPFMQLSAADRRAIIEDLLDIQIFSLMNNLVKARQAEMTAKRNENKVLIEATQEKIAMQTRYMAESEQDIRNRITGYEQEITNHKREIHEHTKHITEATAEITTLSSTIEDREKVQRSIKKAMQLESQIEQTLGKHKKNKSFFEKEATCPTCAQEIEAHFKQTQLQQLDGKIGECESGLHQLSSKTQTYTDRMDAINKVEETIATLKTKIVEYNTSINHLTKFIHKLEETIRSLQKNNTSAEREQERLQEQQQQLQQLEDARKTMIEQMQYYETAGALLKDTGIKTKIIRQYLPIINTLVNKYLASMDFFVNFNLDESFKESIRSRYRDDFSYASFSEGEKQRIDMALMLTWRAIAKLKNSANTNLLILDEIFDSSMDSSGVDELSKILNTLDNSNVFIISHRTDILSDKFSNVIHFKKINNFSRTS